MNNINSALKEKIWIMKKELELTIRNKFSEFIILQLHDEIYDELKEKIDEFTRRIVASDNEIQEKIADFKRILRENALEKKLQKGMLKLLKLVGTENILHSIAELSIVKNDGKDGRIDLFLVPKTPIDSPKIIELKRASISIFPKSRKDKATKALIKAISQIRCYGETSIKRIKSNVGIGDYDLSESEQLLVAGKRLKMPDDYQFILEQEKGLSKLKIYTWDGWISEFERIYT